MLRRASSNLSLVPARILSLVCGGEAGGGARRLSVATRATGRRSLTTFGAVTSMFGSATASSLDGFGDAAGACEGAGVCAKAGPSRPQSSKEATPEAANICLLKADMTSDSDEAPLNCCCPANSTGGLPSMVDGPISMIPPNRRACCADPGPIDRSISGDRRCAGLKRDAGGVQLDELGISGQISQFYRLRLLQQRRRRKQHRMGHRDDGTDRASI